jgi:ribose/xylose/arabinose/galactoside ABC-type transport system permease subunit
VRKDSRNLLRRIFAIKEIGILLILAAMVGAMSVWTGSFASRSNLVSIIQAISPIAIMAIGETFVILTGGIDLSVGSVCALAAYAMSLVLAGEAGYPLWAGILTALATGLSCGIFSGFIITKLRVTPFIVTLGMLSACSGLTLGLSGGKQIGLSKFGSAVETESSIEEVGGEISGQPAVERKFYSESESVDVIRVTPSDEAIWTGASHPGHVSLLSPDWTEKVSAGVDLEEVHCLLPHPGGGVLAAGSPGGKVYRVDPAGVVSLFVDTEAGAVHDMACGMVRSGSATGEWVWTFNKAWIATGDPAQVLEVSPSGEVLRKVPVPDAEAITSIATHLPESLTVWIGTRKPGSLRAIHPDTRESGTTLYTSAFETVEHLRGGAGMDLRMWFTEGNTKPDRLMTLLGGNQVTTNLVWQTPKPPIQDYLYLSEKSTLVSTGNVGAVYLIREGQNPVMLHPMTTHKARTLAREPGNPVLFVGNSGPGGLATFQTTWQKTTYAVADSFNRLFEYAPWAMAILLVFAWLFLRFTTWGTYLYAIGGNEQAARLSGIHVDRMKILAYGATGLLCGLAGVFLTSKLHTLDPSLAKGYELKVIAAVVIGGTSLMGGQGSVWGTLIGAALLYVLNYALVHLGMEDIWSDLFIGAIIILAAVIDSLRSRLPELLAMLGWKRGAAQ